MSGFRLPLPIPEGFTQEPWNLNINDKLARTDLTKIVYDYIKANNLQDPTDKRIVLPDNNIKKLFKMKDGDKLTFFNFQRYMKNALRKKYILKKVGIFSNVKNIEMDMIVKNPKNIEKIHIQIKKHLNMR